MVNIFKEWFTSFISGKHLRIGNFYEQWLEQNKIFTPLPHHFSSTRPHFVTVTFPHSMLSRFLSCFSNVCQSHIYAFLFLAFCLLSLRYLHFYFSALIFFPVNKVISESGLWQFQYSLADINWHHGTVCAVVVAARGFASSHVLNFSDTISVGAINKKFSTGIWIMTETYLSQTNPHLHFQILFHRCAEKAVQCCDSIWQRHWFGRWFCAPARPFGF